MGALLQRRQWRGVEAHKARGTRRRGTTQVGNDIEGKLFGVSNTSASGAISPVSHTNTGHNSRVARIDTYEGDD